MRERPPWRRLYTGRVGEWYSIGLVLGVGVGLGVLLAGSLAATRAGVVAAAVLAASAAVVIGLAVDDGGEAIAGALGAVAGTAGATQVLRGTLRRGGTRAATAALFSLAGVGLGVLALVPAVGYLEALAVPALAARLRRRTASRYAGLRTLARD